MTVGLTPNLLLQAYKAGVFPMAEGRDDPELFWVDPKRRGIFPLDGFYVSRSLARTIKQRHYTVHINRDFEQVVLACADREETWINDQIFDLYCALHHMGQAHSLEVWRDESLIGGVYGVVAGGAFFGESMFSKERDASKIALAYLVHRLRSTGFSLFDTQFITPHLASLGAIEISRSNYHKRLARAVSQRANFLDDTYSEDVLAIAQRSTQTS